MSISIIPSFASFHRMGCVLTTILLTALLASCNNDSPKTAASMLEGFSATDIAETQQRVDGAIQLAGEVGDEEVIRRINEDKAMWNGASYVFVFDARAGTSVANPVFPELIGKRVSDIEDTNGNFLTPLIENATDDGAWVEYYWVNPDTAKPARKVSWVKKSGDYIYGSGLYQQGDQ